MRGLVLRAPVLPVLLVMLMAPSGATLAQCPDREALEKGGTAHVSYPDGSLVGLRWMGAGVVEETTRHGNEGQAFRMLSMGGVFIFDEVDLEGTAEIAASRIVTRYPDTLFERLPVTAGTEMTLTAVSSFADGTEPEVERITLRSGALDEVDIAGCRYSGFPMLLTYEGDDSRFTSMMTHLPALGLSLEIARLGQGTAPLSFVPQRFDLSPP